MVDRDIREHPEAYPRGKRAPDRNIDFRRVPNLLVFFDRQAESLTTDPMTISAWQPGDIVVFGTHHIGIISDKRNKNGIPYLIHNSGQLRREEDARFPVAKSAGISALTPQGFLTIWRFRLILPSIPLIASNFSSMSCVFFLKFPFQKQCRCAVGSSALLLYPYGRGCFLILAKYLDF